MELNLNVYFINREIEDFLWLFNQPPRDASNNPSNHDSAFETAPRKSANQLCMTQVEAKPAVEFEPVAIVPPVASSVSAPAAVDKLPEGWFEAVDPAYNHPYWYNPSSGARTWERPKVIP